MRCPERTPLVVATLWGRYMPLSLRSSQQTRMSLSKSPNKAFYRAFGLVVASLFVGILVLALLVTTSGPRVRHVVEQSITPNGIASVNQGLTVVFDRPIESSDFQ